MQEFGDSDALTAYKEWSGRVDAFWTAYGVAVATSLGVATQSDPGLARHIIGAAFFVFAGGHFFGLRRAQKLFCKTAKVLRVRAERGQIPEDFRPIFAAASAGPPCAVGVFHFILTIVVLVSILFLPNLSATSYHGKAAPAASGRMNCPGFPGGCGPLGVRGGG